MDNQDKLEAISIDIWKNGVHFTVIGLYNPPNNVPNLDLIMNMSQHHNTIVVGDFNAHSTRWGTLLQMQPVNVLKTCSTSPVSSELLPTQRFYRTPGTLVPLTLH